MGAPDVDYIVSFTQCWAVRSEYITVVLPLVKKMLVKLTMVDSLFRNSSPGNMEWLKHWIGKKENYALGPVAYFKTVGYRSSAG